MALIACPECSAQVSAGAASCPRCGHTITSPLSAPLKAIGCGVLAIVAFVIVALLAGR